MPRHRQTALSCAALVLVVIAGAGCSSDTKTPTAGSFTAGPCRQSAAAVLEVGTAVKAVRSGKKKADEIAPTLTHDQDTLVAAGNVPKELAELVREIGFFRISVDTRTYDSSRLEALSAKQAAAVRACTGATPAGS